VVLLAPGRWGQGWVSTVVCIGQGSDRAGPGPCRGAFGFPQSTSAIARNNDKDQQVTNYQQPTTEVKQKQARWAEWLLATANSRNMAARARNRQPTTANPRPRASHVALIDKERNAMRTYRLRGAFSDCCTRRSRAHGMSDVRSAIHHRSLTAHRAPSWYPEVPRATSFVLQLQ
jgi:hypothetical protein